MVMEKNRNNEQALGRLFLFYLEEISSDEHSENYLIENGFDPDHLVEETIAVLRERLTKEDPDRGQ